MALIHNLAEHDMGSCSVRACQPSDDRLVIVQAVQDERVKTIGARYRAGRWIAEETGFDVTDNLGDYAVWSESILFLPSSCSTTVPIHAPAA